MNFLFSSRVKKPLKLIFGKFALCRHVQLYFPLFSQNFLIDYNNVIIDCIFILIVVFWKTSVSDILIKKKRYFTAVPKLVFKTNKIVEESFLKRKLIIRKVSCHEFRLIKPREKNPETSMIGVAKHNKIGVSLHGWLKYFFDKQITLHNKKIPYWMVLQCFFLKFVIGFSR